MSLKDKCVVSRRIDEPQRTVECCIYSRATDVSSQLQHLNQIEAVLKKEVVYLSALVRNTA